MWFLFEWRHNWDTHPLPQSSTWRALHYHSPSRHTVQGNKTFIVLFPYKYNSHISNVYVNNDDMKVSIYIPKYLSAFIYLLWTTECPICGIFIHKFTRAQGIWEHSENIQEQEKLHRVLAGMRMLWHDPIRREQEEVSSVCLDLIL